jgi:hypothetical protein
MRPGHIRVFDGLRITTEHMDHFQSSLHSAIQDLREIIGLGLVCYGFDVAADGSNQIIVKPGLAFDFQRNRIVNDEPKSIAVTFEGEEKEKYVCVQYDQIQDGEVEGQFTLIWDSCSISLLSELPTPEQNVVVLAALIKTEAGFDVVSTSEAESDQVFLAPTEQPPIETTSPPEPNVTVEAASIPVETEPIGSKDNQESASLEPASAVEVTQPMTLQIRQGITKCGIDTGVYLKTILLEPLLLKYQTGNANDSIELRIPLGRQEILRESNVISLTTQSIVVVTLSLQSESSANGEGSESYDTCVLHAVGPAEITFENNTIYQFGLSTIHSDKQSCSSHPIPEFTDQAIANLPFMAAKNGNKIYNEVLSRLQLLLQINRSETDFVEAAAFLRWSGNVTEEWLKEIESKKCGLVWQASIGWKSMSGGS